MSEGAGVPGRPGLKERAVEEGRRFLVMFLYLWALFALFALHERMVLREVGADLPMQGFAFVNALVLAKVMLLAENLNFASWLRDRPLIWPILHQSFAFALLFIAVHYLEHMGLGWLHGESWRASVPAIAPAGSV